MKSNKIITSGKRGHYLDNSSSHLAAFTEVIWIFIKSGLNTLRCTILGNFLTIVSSKFFHRVSNPFIPRLRNDCSFKYGSRPSDYN